jgi:glycosyltransferase involved in cell wall biosynthesis
MISLNEAHNMNAVLQNLSGWAQEVFLVDSYSADDTVDIALRYGVHVVQRKFQDFGDQWNFALRELPIKALWTMKLDPDERLTDDLKDAILKQVENRQEAGISFDRRLFFMGRQLPIEQEIIRIWKTGVCHFTCVAVNEHPIVGGSIQKIQGCLEHHDSPDLAHWLEKQNRYTTAEAIIAFQRSALADTPSLLGTPLQRRMWLKRYFYQVPGRYFLFFLYCWLWQGAWRSGWVGYAWARLRADVMRLVEYKRREMEITGRLPISRPSTPGVPDRRVPQYD